MSLFIRSIALIAAAICGSAGTAHAQVVSCVNSVAEFDAAYRLSALQSVTIKMVAGSWSMIGSTLDRQRADFFFPRRSVRIEGGYNPGCTSRSSNPGATVLDGSVLEFEGSSAGASTLHIERLTFLAASRVRFAFAEGL